MKTEIPVVKDQMNRVRITQFNPLLIGDKTMTMQRLDKPEIAQALKFVEELDALKRRLAAAEREVFLARQDLRDREFEIGEQLAPAKPGQVIEWTKTITEWNKPSTTRRNRMIVGKVAVEFAVAPKRDEDGATVFKEDGTTPELSAGVYFRFVGLRVKADDSLGSREDVSTKYMDSEISIVRPDEDPAAWVKPDKDDRQRPTTREQIDHWLKRAVG